LNDDCLGRLFRDRLRRAGSRRRRGNVHNPRARISFGAAAEQQSNSADDSFSCQNTSILPLTGVQRLQGRTTLRLSERLSKVVQQGISRLLKRGLELLILRAANGLSMTTSIFSAINQNIPLREQDSVVPQRFLALPRQSLAGMRSALPLTRATRP